MLISTPNHGPDPAFPTTYTFDIVAFLDALDADTETIELKWNRLTHLPSLAKFIKLKRLDVSHNLLTSLPAGLPDTIEILICEDNLLTRLPRMPRKLKRLVCGGNRLVALPKFGPALNVVYCMNNSIEQLPEFNSQLVKIYAYNNRIRSLPKTFNKYLVELDVSNNLLEELPTNINERLEKLLCAYNMLQTLPAEFNERLRVLNCSYNRLKELPADLARVEELVCDGNHIRSIPPLRRVQRFSCTHNPLYQLPQIGPLTTKLNVNNIPIGKYVTDGDCATSIEQVRRRVDTLNRFRFAYYASKLRPKFVAWFQSTQELVVIAQ